MKRAFPLLLSTLTFWFSARAEQEVLDRFFLRVVEAIYKAEGGAKTRWPYGIKSIETNNPRQICFNTVRNNYYRWKASGAESDFIPFLADRYCPAAADPAGHDNWLRNVLFFLNHDGHKD